jgi:hypothetical protein
MNGDFSRDTSHTAHLERYTRVLLQQGRALLDADFNEQSAIHLDLLRTFIADSMGRGWRPPVAGQPGGFEIKPVNPADPRNFTITKGHFYVDVILCDNPIERTYVKQPFLLHPPALDQAKFIVYIECWERHLCAVQQPALREVALGGPDTASRAQLVWQVRAATAAWVKAQAEQVKGALDVRFNAENNIEEKQSLNDMRTALGGATSDLSDLIESIATVSPPTDIDVSAKSQHWFDALSAAPPRLRAMAKRDALDTEACVISPNSIYRGRENQLYRVEIHDGGTAEDRPTFKWSRENGSVMFAVRAGGGIKVGSDVVSVPVETLGHDRRTGLCVGDWVEVSSEAFELEGFASPLGQVKQIDRTRRIIEIQIDGPKPDFSECTLLRRWDQTEHLDTNGTVAITEASGTNADTWTPLERGVQIQFQPGGVYRTGDYWLIPARVSSGDVLWPRQPGIGNGPAFMAPTGIRRHVAALDQWPPV